MDVFLKPACFLQPALCQQNNNRKVPITQLFSSLFQMAEITGLPRLELLRLGCNVYSRSVPPPRPFACHWKCEHKRLARQVWWPLSKLFLSARSSIFLLVEKWQNNCVPGLSSLAASAIEGEGLTPCKGKKKTKGGKERKKKRGAHRPWPDHKMTVCLNL